MGKVSYCSDYIFFAEEFSGKVPKKVICGLVQGVLEEYEALVKEEFALDARIRFHCTCKLAFTVYELRWLGVLKISGSCRKAEGYLKSAWEQWCQMMGISVDELGSIFRSESCISELCGIIGEDAVSGVIYDLYDKMKNSNDKLVCSIQKIRKNEDVLNGNEMQCVAQQT